MKRSKAVALGLAAFPLILAGCGIQEAQASQYLHVVPGTNVVDVKVVSSLNNNLAENTIDGVPAGHLTITVPVGSQVHLQVTNQGAQPETFGIYNGTQLAFNGSGDNYYTDVNLNATDGLMGGTAGLLSGQSQTYVFTASKVGTYTLADLLNGADPSSNIPVSNIWETFKIRRS